MVLKKEVVAQAARPIRHERFGESELGDLAADSVRDAAQADAAFVNPGGLRVDLQSGPIHYGDIFQALPFDNQIVRLHVSGRELKLILRVAESGSRGFFPVSNLKIKVIHPADNAPSSDLNANGKIDSWEINRLLEVKFADGTPIHDDKSYTLATLDFLVTGGDDMGWVMGQLPADHKTDIVEIIPRDAVVHYLKKIAAAGPVNSEEHPLIDPQNPRLVFEKAGHGKSRSHRRKRRHIT